MESNISVRTSGPALSFLIFETTKTSGNQVGLLLGSVIEQTTDTINDSDIQGAKIETTINITYALPMPSQYELCYNNLGEIDEGAIYDILREEKGRKHENLFENIVGWYCFNRNSSPVLSNKERNVHTQLSQLATNLAPDTNPNLFLVCLLTTNSLENIATHIFKHSFMRYNNNGDRFEVLPFHISHLGESRNTHYQHTATSPSLAYLESQIFDELMKEGCSETDLMNKSREKIKHLLESRVEKLLEIEKLRIQLQNEVDNLKMKVSNREALKFRMNYSGSMDTENDDIEKDSEEMRRSPVLGVNTVRGTRKSRHRDSPNVPITWSLSNRFSDDDP